MIELILNITRISTMKTKATIETYRVTKKKITIPVDIDISNKGILEHLHKFTGKPVIISIEIDPELMKIEINKLTDKQRAMIYALIKDYAINIGYSEDEAKQQLKTMFCEEKELPKFSLSDCNTDLAGMFIDYIVDCLLHAGIVTNTIKKAYTDVNFFGLKMLEFGFCVVCGQAGEVHHIDTIGMGRDRKTVDDTEYKKICLCRQHHSECHNTGWAYFSSKYHFENYEVR